MQTEAPENNIENLRAKLSEKVPQNLVSTRVMYHDRRTGRDVTADYISGGAAILLLNNILGNENWSSNIRDFRHEEITLGGREYIVYSCISSITARIGDREIHKEDVGTFIVEKDKRGAANVIEAAIKGAATDALKRCARQIAQVFGNSLYLDDDAVAGYFASEEPKEPASEEMVADIVKLAKAVKSDPDLFLDRVKKRLGIEDIKEIDEESAKKLIASLNSAKRKKPA